MKLRKLHIEDYKMFKDFDISFVDENDEPLPIVVLAGVNGSGKTTILESLYSPDKKKMKLETTDTIYIDKEYNRNIKNSTTINGNILGIGTIQQHIYNVGGNDISSEDMKLLKKAKERLEVKEKNNVIYFSSDSDYISKVEQEFVKYWYKQVKFHNKRNDEITKSLQKFITESFNELDLTFTYSHIDEDDNILFQNDNNEKFKINELSTGEKTLLSRVLYLFLKEYKNKVILIDEPELSLHPSWQNKVLKIYENFAKQNNCQIIIATHSPHIIGSAKAEYVRVLKKIDNKIKVYEYTKSYGLEFNKILVDIMEADTRVSDVSERLSKIKSLIIQNDFDSDEFKEVWSDLERLIGADNIDLKLLKLEIASRRKKNVSNR